MQKRLVTVGNGLALFIDRPLRKLLELEAGTLVTVRTDGVRLTIERVGHSEPTARPRLEPWDAPRFVQASAGRTSEERRFEYEAPAVLRDLVARGMTDRELIELHHRRWPADMWNLLFGSERPWFLNEHDRADLRRFAACREALVSGESISSAMAIALAAVPMESLAPWRGARAFEAAMRLGDRQAGPAAGVADAAEGVTGATGATGAADAATGAADAAAGAAGTADVATGAAGTTEVSPSAPACRSILDELLGVDDYSSPPP